MFFMTVILIKCLTLYLSKNKVLFELYCVNIGRCLHLTDRLILFFLHE